MRLGVSPTAASTPTGVFSQRFEALPPHSGTMGCVVCHLVHQLLPHQPATALPSPLHNLPPCWVCQPPPCCESSPPLLPVWMNVSSLSPWLLDFHAVQFYVSSGCFLFLNCCYPFDCARRHGVYLHLHLGRMLIYFIIMYVSVILHFLESTLNPPL